MLASLVAVSRATAHAPRRVVGQWGGAGGAIYEEHFEPAVCEGRGDGRLSEKPVLLLACDGDATTLFERC